MSIPTIESIIWGTIVVVNEKGERKKYKDVKVGPTGASAWDWRITGTSHQPGIQLSDIQEYIDADVDEIILSRGMQLMLEIHPDTKQYLSYHGIEFYEAQTEKAVAYYNECVANGKKVAGVFHSTC